MPTGVYPRAIWRPVPQAPYAAPIVPTAVVLHSNAGVGGDLYSWWTNPQAGGLYSHFQVGLDGTVWQYCSIFRRAPANVMANAFGVSFETSNNPGHGTFPGFDTDRWTDPQRAALIDAVEWVCAQTGIPRAACLDGVHGIGGHDWFPAWTTPGHVCPGAVRRVQVRSDIIPAAAGPDEEDDMTLTPDQAKQLTQVATDSSAAATHAAYARMYAQRATGRAQSATDWAVLAALPTIYAVELGREVDPAGLAYWRSKAAQGVTPDQAQRAIHDTPEAQRYRAKAAA